MNPTKFAITSSSEVAEIMLPLIKQHGMTVFNYYRTYFDGSMIRFSTHRSWTEHYFKKDYMNNMRVPKDYLTKPVNYFVWLTEDCPEMLQDAAINFDMSNGISIAERHADYMEYFCFSTTLKNTTIINRFYLNNLDVLRKYGAYFKDTANKLIHVSESNKIILSNKESCKLDIQPMVHDKLSTPIKLSKQQYLCAELLLQGMKSKEIAYTLTLSPRTVESYLNHIKEKLRCRNKVELIIKLADIFNISV